MVNENLVYLYFKYISENENINKNGKFFEASELEKHFKRKNILRLYRYFNNASITKKLFEIFENLNKNEKVNFNNEECYYNLKNTDWGGQKLLEIEYEKEKIEKDYFKNIIAKWTIDYLIYDSYFDIIYIISQIVGYDISKKIILEDISRDEYIDVLKKKDNNNIKDIFERMYNTDKKYNGTRKLGIDIYDRNILKEIISKYFNEFFSN